MSFDLNGIPSQKPTIREAQNMQNNGGGGNLGYMQQGSKKKKDEGKSKEEAKLHIEEEDKFVKSGEAKKEETEQESKISGTFKSFVKDLIHKKQSKKNNPFKN